MEKDNLVVSYKFSPWRTWIVKKFFPDLSKNFSKIENILNLAEKTKLTLLVWSTTLEDEKIEITHPNLTVLRLEDGFIRSVGLGAALIPPFSLVADKRGIYFDSLRPSDLEVILQETLFDSTLIERARHILTLLKKYKITKYNLNGTSWIPKGRIWDKKILLVPGQVEGDKSIQYGSPLIKTNLELLQIVREKNPFEYIVYKPHPDVKAGFRKGYYSEKLILKIADEIIWENVDNHELLQSIDEVHTICSLIGFEALFLGKEVFCYGQPFYSGWSLTKDLLPNPRRRRKLTLEELIVGCIILYPMYINPFKNQTITPEEVIEELWQLKNNPSFKFLLYKNFSNILSPFIKIKNWWRGI
ncbi:MAG: beta-3-deoxy-D-manno-oct-2-ulosonic acid transferase [Elusimicrobiota bacterium]|nr:beta-3-deoxy-D-manno-oct-2-ulosonic acid transferase [Endomicrobiia bacterium]MDW7998801.1 hypothetical protein [Thermodesulfovibrio sp.]MDW8165898.1 beta-3-deoxy-D-manno-oct-2-ulosonic acid transferase [Elusimicrobiota bacterium]